MTCKRWRTQIRRWRIDLKISEVVVGELTRWRNDRLPLTRSIGKQTAERLLISSSFTLF